MKKIVLIFGITAALFSCKKDEAPAFVATDLTGITKVSGVISHEDYWTGDDAPLAGVTVTVTVKNNQLYPNSPSAQGALTYTGTTDANGIYSIDVKTNSVGVSSLVSFSKVTKTVDASNGTVYTYYKSGGDSFNETLYSEVPKNYSYVYSETQNTDFSNIPVGSAIVRGKITIGHYVQQTSNTSSVFTIRPLELANRTVRLIYAQDPTTLQERVYTTTTSSNGDYSFNIDATNRSYNLDYSYEVEVLDYDTSRDSISFTGVVLSSELGVYSKKSLNGSVSASEVENSKDLYYSTFIAD